MTDIDELIDDLISAVRDDCAAYEWGSPHTDDIAKARAALLAAFPRWIPFSEQRPPEDALLYTARTFQGKAYWVAVPHLEEPQP
jgi:hypothetical protein